MRRSFVEFLRAKATGLLALRAGIVAANFAVMIGLAAWLGLADFGVLIYLWGISLVAATVLSAGGPLILLRDLTSGASMRRADVVALTVVLPFGLALLAGLFFGTVWPDLPWVAILASALAINSLNCVASFLRAQGSTAVSMTLRDAGPFVALGVAAVLPNAAEAMILRAALIMAGMVVCAVVWAFTLSNDRRAFDQAAHRSGYFALWIASVLGMIVAQMDLIIGGIFLPPEVLGAYAVLRRVANVVALPVSVATWVTAAPVSKAFGAGDMAALQRASANGSEIAWFPAIAMATIGFCGLGVGQFIPAFAQAGDMVWVFAIVLIGALLQAYWASGFTVATLTRFAKFAAMSRVIAVGVYICCVAVIGTGLSAVSNAVVYIFAISLSSLFLWFILRRRLGVDTSAWILWGTRGMVWKAS